MENENIRFETQIIKPQQAETWLEMSKDNRTLTNHKVREYANEIKSGRWRYTHQGIAFDNEGYLLDGQHRLKAIMEAGIAIKTVIAYGVARGEFTIIDRGFPRNMMVITGIDKFHTECYVYLITIATKHAQRPMPDDVYTLHKILGNTLTTLQDYCNAKVKYFTSAPIRTAAMVAIQNGEDQNYVLSAYRSLALGVQTMPTVAFAFFKSYDPKKVSSGWYGRIKTYSKARYVFTKDKASIDRITLNEGFIEKYIKEASDIVSKVLIASPDKEKSILLKQIEEKDRQLEIERRKYLKVLSENIQSEQTKLSMGAKD